VERRKTENVSTKLKNPWYVGIRYGTKSYLHSDDLSRDLIRPNVNKYQSISVGHYINQKMALEFGLEYSQFVFSTPFGDNFLLREQNIFSVPFAMRYDILQTDRVALYGKGLFSTDFRINPPRSIFTEATGFITDNNNLLLNAGIETGIDFRVFKGVNIGIVGKYNHAFSRAALYQYPEETIQGQYEFRDINLVNKYFSWGVELKYKFNG